MDTTQVDAWPRHRYKYTKCKIGLSMMVLIYIKQHFSNMGSSIHEKVKQHCGRVEKKHLASLLVSLNKLFFFTEMSVALKDLVLKSLISEDTLLQKIHIS